VSAHRPRAVLLALLAVVAGPAPGDEAPGQVRYVVEQLVVNVNSAADGSGTRVAILRSGDQVQLLERSGEAAHVRLANGRDGWVRASYLMETEPLRMQLAARSEEVATLRQQLQALSAARPPAAAAAPAEAASPAPAPAEDEDPGAAHRLPWGWLVAVGVVSLGLGFAVGWLALDARIRRRYGGLRIY
jgi:hypothetical protein